MATAAGGAAVVELEVRQTAVGGLHELLQASLEVGGTCGLGGSGAGVVAVVAATGTVAGGLPAAVVVAAATLGGGAAAVTAPEVGGAVLPVPAEALWTGRSSKVSLLSALALIPDL